MTTKIISADSHIMEPPGLWLERLDQPFRDRAPRVVNEWKGRKGEFLICDGRLLRPVYGGFPANKPLHEIPPTLNPLIHEACGLCSCAPEVGISRAY
jgi:hypothetical protein